ncbi:Hypothetical Protein FCC1311_022142 [Hondaea fermentalgiana]|uniref:BSD domain-containing protein n=1 Tax=Hondaea fermentalgiana TaxID=2315210 RepID=A0A2R5GDX8_9STRA|nr:Hypothetical Protein FCC1311_022142 [Hondaea fermentalgiana]|eukprot:GBG25994.1 Hypothetical Protein FCC1311_022142 [Hondaea fermentalgiana]
MASSGMLDPSVSHETYGFIQTLMQDPASAKKLFFSYDKILARRPTTAKFSMTKEQNQHARSIIQAIPEFDKLRFTLAPSYMPDNRFWEVYFTLIWEKHCVGASKGEEYDADPSDESAYSTLTRPSSRLAPARGSRSEAKEEVVTPEDLSKGMKREREDSMDNNSDIAGDIAIVSRLLFNGARRTFQFAEQFIEAMDERASSASATTPANDATKPPTTGTASSATAPTASLASSKKSDAKRGRFEASADSNLFPAPEDKLKDCDVEPNVAAGDTSDGAETDGFSVASVDDADLHEWATVSPSPRSRKTLTVPSLGTEDVDHVEDFEWI